MNKLFFFIAKHPALNVCLLALLFGLFACGNLGAQTVTIAPNQLTGFTTYGSSYTYYPFASTPFDYYDNKFVACGDIYKSSEIGAITGTISTLEWDNLSSPASTTIPIKVYMKMVPSTTNTWASTGVAYSTTVASATLVYSGNIVINANGWADPLTITPFPYTSGNNLEIFTESDFGSTHSSAPSWYDNTTASNADAFWASSTSAGLQTATYSRDALRPAIKITFIACTAPTISASSLGAQTVCQSASASATPLTVTAAGSSPYTYQWYSDATGLNSGGTSVGSANGGQTASFTPPITAASTTYYYCVVTGQCTPTASSAASGAITVQSLTNNPGTITLSSTSECVGGAAITVANTVSATTGTPASTGPSYDFYYNLNGTGWVPFQNSTTATATVPAIVTNTIGTNSIARNSYWGCAAEANSANTVINITVTGPNVQNATPTGVGTGGATLNGTF